MNNSQFSDLVTFVRNESRAFDISIERNTEIEKDLGITGDDAESLIVNFSKRYNVDISDFSFIDYFNDEPVFFANNRSIKKMTIGDLEKAIQVGYLK